MKSMKETIIFGIIMVLICLGGIIYTTVFENPKTNDEPDVKIETPVITPESEVSESEPINILAPSNKSTSTITLSDSQISSMIKTSHENEEKARQDYQALLDSGYVRWSQPDPEPEYTPELEPEVVEEEEIIPEKNVEPTPTRPVSTSYNSKDEYFNDLLNSFSDWEIDTSNLEFYGTKYITGYDACIECCGKSSDDPNYGVTASLSHVKMGRTCAVNGLTFGTVLYIEGIGIRIVEDRGGMKNGNIDVYCDTHSQCYEVTGTYDVWVLWSPDWV